MFHKTDPLITARICALVRPDIVAAQNDRDLRTRLARIGFGYKDTTNGRVLTTLPHQIELFQLAEMNL